MIGFFLCLFYDYCFVLSLNTQIHFVKDQQDEITTKLNTEYQVLEEEIIGCGLEVHLSLLVYRYPPSLSAQL